MGFASLNIKSEYSILDSLLSIKTLVKRANDLSYTSLAITDTNNLFGVYEFYLECKKYNIKPIIGMEVEFDDTSFLLYAKNNLGYKRLLAINTSLCENEFSFDLLKDNDDLIIIYPYKFFRKDVYDIFRYRYVGYYNEDEKSNIDNNYKKVFLNTVRYIDKDDYIYIDYLHMIRDGKVLGESELNKYKNMYLFSGDELVNILSKEELGYFNEIVDMCDVTFSYQDNLLPLYDNKVNSYLYLEMLCNKGLKKRLNNCVSKIYQDRLDYELSVIRNMGFCDYFLIVWDYVKYAKFNNILVGPGRGSAAGSLVSYSLGITEIDPIKYDLLFERFLNPNRVTMPDIDIDFDNERIDDVISYVTDKYGEKKVAGIITFVHLSSKQVIRDVGRILKVNNLLLDSVSKLIDGSLMESINKSVSLKRLVTSNVELKKLYTICLKLEGRVRNISMHAAGIVICNTNIDEVIPIYKSDNMYLTAFTKDYLESLGLLKMDFLRLSTLSFINRVILDIRRYENINITFDRIPIDDKKTLEIFYNAQTDGIFQFESSGMKKFLSKLKCKSFNEVVDAIALFRPGPLSNIDTYIKRKNGVEEISYIDPSFKDILKSTYGIIIYQEQIMQIANVMAGYSYGEADLLRRAISKKDESKLMQERPKFIEGAKKRGYSSEKAEYVFDLILKFADYGFNKSHSVAYAMIGYKMAFLKKYFLKYFLVELLNNSIGNKDKINLYLMEARNNGISVMYPDVNFSSSNFIVKDNSILCPLTIVRGVLGNVCLAICEERTKGKFTSFIDFVVRCYSFNLNVDVISSLIYAGCFQSLSYNRKTLIANLDKIINYAQINNDLIDEPCIDEVLEYDRKDIIDLEYSVYGFYLFSHPTLLFKGKDDVDLINISSYFNCLVSVIILVKRIKEVVTKKMEVMAFVSGSDNTAFLDVVLFPNVIANIKLNKGDIIRVYGRVEKRYDSYQIIASKVFVVNKKDTLNQKG